MLQPASYKDDLIRQELESTDWDLFIVVAYNFILPQWLLDLPKKGCLNLHPSLLPQLRGPSPIRTAIKENRPDAVGVTIMLLDEKMDHGPIIAQAAVTTETNWPVNGQELDETLANSGAYLLAETVPKWLAGDITPKEQNHEQATYSKLFKKGENEIAIDPFNLPQGDEAFRLLCLIRAWSGMGDTYFVHEGTRVKVKTAHLAADGSLVLDAVVPAGKPRNAVCWLSPIVSFETVSLSTCDLRDE